MARARAVRGLVAALTLLGAGCASSPPGTTSITPSRPNIVLVVADDLGWGDLSAYGGPVATPNLDALVQSGVMFTDAHASAYQCSPSRAGLLTGRYQQRFGHESNYRGPGDGVGGIGLAAGMRAFEAGTLPPSELGLPTSQPMLAESLKAAGYTTGMIGKWHLGFEQGKRPTERGFDWFYGFLSGSSPYALSSTPGVITARRVGLGDGADKAEEDDEGMGSPLPASRSLYYTVRAGLEPASEQGEYLTDLFTRQTSAFIARQQSDRPFFLYLAHLAPHQPLTTTRQYYDRLPQMKDEKRRIYYSMILALDDGIGRLQADLKARGLDRNTLIIFTSDNGCPRPRAFCSNGPLREGKQTMYEGGNKVPLIMSWPGHTPAGRVDAAPVSLLDIGPTIARLARAKNPAAPAAYDGVDLTSRLEVGAAAPARDLYWRAQIHRAISDGRWKLLIHHAIDGRDVEFLYDLKTDPGETTNRLAEHPDIADRLRSKLAKWNAGLAEPRWIPPNPKRRTFDGVTIDLY